MAEQSSCNASDSSASSQVLIPLETFKTLMAKTGRTAVPAELATLHRSGAASGISRELVAQCGGWLIAYNHDSLKRISHALFSFQYS